jgi:hypothetical protein
MLKPSILLALLLGAHAALPAAAQEQQHAIHVVGYGELQVEPDIATFTFAIQGQADSAQNARSRADQISGDLVRRLERLGIAAEDIRSTPVALYPFIDGRTQRELVSFNRTTTAILRDLEDFDAVQNAALEAGVNSIGGVQYGLSNEDELLNQARDLALMDARAQAEGIARTMGVQVGRVLSVNVARSRGVVPYYRQEAALAAAADQAAPEHRTGLVDITQDASVSFEIIQQPFSPRP